MNTSEFNVRDNLAEDQGPSLGQTLRKFVPWLIVIGLAILFLPLYAISSTIGADTDRLNAELSNIQLTMVSEPTVPPEVVALQSDAADIEAQLSELEGVYANLSADHIDWPEVAAAIRNYDTSRISLTSLQQTDNRLMLTGQAVDDTAVINYARFLEDSGQFARVVVQSITLTTPSPTPTVQATTAVTPTVAGEAATPTPGSSGSDSGGTGSTPQPGSTPTSDGRDAYEVDNTVAKPIYLGEIQSHNFYPNFDVDTAVFLAKAGRYYKVETGSLAPGVDTFLTVTIGNTVLTNDDAKPGTLSSEVAFQMAADRDAEVTIQVTNRGQYGIQMSYQLFVEEIVPTVNPTVAPTGTAVPTATATPAPPTATPTATPDLRDPYEPDNTSPGLIAVGEIQTHNFFPNGDVDMTSFLVKQNHHYQVATTNLALGVDTAMKVQLGVNEWENDDYAKAGSGNFASAVCFPAASDGLAIVTVSQSGAYAPDKTYNISLAEVPELKIDQQQLNFGPVAVGDPSPAAQNINLTGTSLINWTAETEAAWLSLSAANGTTPATLGVSTNITGLAPGLYEDSVRLSWATVCQHNITVTLQVNATSFNIPRVPAESPLVLTGLELGDTAVLSPRDLPMAKRNNYQSGPVEFVIILELKGGAQ
ncbi:MAG: PilN domain-containing protein [Ardenticatenaceae bacterium]|nr:PilN domain-containing protein [Ardenticatenaceae bacterium]MCB9444373.1 PilN domain-containing protein [Ardenticatenaceae bacterium]